MNAASVLCVPLLSVHLHWLPSPTCVSPCVHVNKSLVYYTVHCVLCLYLGLNYELKHAPNTGKLLRNINFALKKAV